MMIAKKSRMFDLANAVFILLAVGRKPANGDR